MSQTILVLNGPNLNRLGTREPGVYGTLTLDQIEARVQTEAGTLGVCIRCVQSNHEGVLVDAIHEASDSGIVFNPGAFTHTSFAILDALNAYDPPVIEVHISQVHKREAFRHHSYVSLRADGVIAGLGLEGYAAAVRRICQLARQAG